MQKAAEGPERAEGRPDYVKMDGTLRS